MRAGAAGPTRKRMAALLQVSASGTMAWRRNTRALHRLARQRCKACRRCWPSLPALATGSERPWQLPASANLHDAAGDHPGHRRCQAGKQIPTRQRPATSASARRCNYPATPGLSGHGRVVTLQATPSGAEGRRHETVAMHGRARQWTRYPLQLPTSSRARRTAKSPCARAYGSTESRARPSNCRHRGTRREQGPSTRDSAPAGVPSQRPRRTPGARAPAAVNASRNGAGARHNASFKDRGAGEGTGAAADCPGNDHAAAAAQCPSITSSRSMATRRRRRAPRGNGP